MKRSYIIAAVLLIVGGLAALAAGLRSLMRPVFIVGGSTSKVEVIAPDLLRVYTPSSASWQPGRYGTPRPARVRLVAVDADGVQLADVTGEPGEWSDTYTRSTLKGQNAMDVSIPTGSFPKVIPSTWLIAYSFDTIPTFSTYDFES